MDLNNISRLSALNGASLNAEEVSGLQVAMLQRKLEENLNGKLYFWGKIFGAKQDYLIVFLLDTADDFPSRKYYFCTTSDYLLRQMPNNSVEYNEQAAGITSMFVGDPSFFAFNGEEAEPEPPGDDPDAKPVEIFREVNRLSYIVKKIDNEACIIPKGALVIDALKRAKLTEGFEGLSFGTSLEKRAYFHFRKPESLQGLAVMKRPGIVRSGDFLDCIERCDVPQEMWSISHDSTGTMAHVKNLYWEGYHFYHVINSSEFGSAYFGTGVACNDIAFML